MFRHLGLLAALCLASEAGAQLTRNPAALLHDSGLIDGTRSDTTPFVAATPDGHFVVAWYSFFNLGGTIGNDPDIFYVHFDDTSGSAYPTKVLNSHAASDSSKSDDRPRLAVDGLGNWVCAWEYLNDLDSNGSDEADQFYARSTNNGATWSTAAPLDADHYLTDTNGDVRVRLAGDDEGNWIAVWASANTIGESGTDMDIFYARSMDGGATWSAAAPLNSTATSDSAQDTLPVVATDGAGNWVVVWQTTNQFVGPNNDFDVAFTRSTDDGLTWSPAAPLNSDAASTYAEQDIQLATDTLGNWVCVWRSNNPMNGSGNDADVYFARSTDNGATWSNLALLNHTATLDSSTDSDEQISLAASRAGFFCAWRSVYNLEGAGTDGDIQFAVSQTGATWSRVQLANDYAASPGDVNDQNPNVAGDDDGNWVIAWTGSYDFGDNGTEEDIVFTRITTAFTTPVVESIVPVESPTSASDVAFTVTFDQDVLGFDSTSEVLVNHLGGTAHTGLTLVGGPRVYTVTLMGVTGEGDITIAIDTATDIRSVLEVDFTDTITSDPLTVDHTAPLIDSITPQFTSPTNLDSLSYSVAFNEAVTGFDAADLLVSNVGVTHGAISITGGPAVYTVTLEDVDGDGDIAFSIDAGNNIEDLAGHALGNVQDSGVTEVDNTAPVIQDIVVAPSTGQAGEVIGISFTSSEELAEDPLVLVNGIPVPPASKDTAFNYEYTIMPGDPVGMAEITVTGVDAAGNEGQASVSNLLEILPSPASVPLAAWPLCMAIAAASTLVARRRRQ
jgi:hypothetical protein